jgi:hypothetical protein
MPGPIDGYVAALATPWQREACGWLLTDIRGIATFGEHIKWANPYFEIDGAAVIKWFRAKEWINVYFFRGTELEDPHGLFEATDNAKMRTIKIYESSDIDRSAFRELVAAAVRLAR